MHNPVDKPNIAKTLFLMLLGVAIKGLVIMLLWNYIVVPLLEVNKITSILQGFGLSLFVTALTFNPKPPSSGNNMLIFAGDAFKKDEVGVNSPAINE